MLRIEITGTTVQELFESAAGVLGLLVTGGQTMAAYQIGSTVAGAAAVGSLAGPEAVSDAASRGSASDTAHAMSVIETDHLVTDTPADAVRKRGRPKKVIENFKPDDRLPREASPEFLNDPVPDLVGDAQHASIRPTYTLDDHVRPKIRDLMKVRQTYLEATLPKEQHKNIMTQVTDWMLANLFAPFGIKKASDLPAERFPEFMALAARLEAVA